MEKLIQLAPDLRENRTVRINDLNITVIGTVIYGNSSTDEIIVVLNVSIPASAYVNFTLTRVNVSCEDVVYSFILYCKYKLV